MRFTRSRGHHDDSCSHTSHVQHAMAHVIGRFSHGRGFGRHGGGRGWGGFGNGGEFPAGRKLSADDLQLVLEALLQRAPAHGYDLIRQLETLSGGFYKPSPGMIYPALTYLEEGGLAEIRQEGARKLYVLTAEGQAHATANADRAHSILEALERIGGRMGEVRDAFAGVNDIDPSAGEALHMARHALKRALVHKRGADAREVRRITEILLRAARDIETGMEG